MLGLILARAGGGARSIFGHRVAGAQGNRRMCRVAFWIIAGTAGTMGVGVVGLEGLSC
jgi:hypothetical protein